MRRFSLFLALLLVFSGNVAGAQEMADTLRSNGKIYVVVLVLATIFAGIIAFLIFMDRRLRKLEKDSHKTS